MLGRIAMYLILATQGSEGLIEVQLMLSLLSQRNG